MFSCTPPVEANLDDRFLESIVSLSKRDEYEKLLKISFDLQLTITKLEKEKETLKYNERFAIHPAIDKRIMKINSLIISTAPQLIKVLLQLHEIDIARLKLNLDFIQTPEEYFHAFSLHANILISRKLHLETHSHIKEVFPPVKVKIEDYYNKLDTYKSKYQEMFDLIKAKHNDVDNYLKALHYQRKIFKYALLVETHSTRIQKKELHNAYILCKFLCDQCNKNRCSMSMETMKKFIDNSINSKK